MSNRTNCIRGTRGKLVCVWSPVLHGEGCSTAACCVGFGMQYFSGKRILIVNKSNSRSHMEKYIETDIEVKYSMDNLKIFNSGIKAEHVLTYATQVNSSLYIIAGSRLTREITKEKNEFDILFIERCLEAFDIVLVDVETGVREENELYLKLADKILAVFAPNEIILDQLYNHPDYKSELDAFISERTFYLLNKLYDEWADNKVIERYMNRYSVGDLFGLNYHGDLLNACCSDRNLYSFLMKELECEKNIFAVQLKEICEFLLGELYEGWCYEGNTGGMNLLKRFLRSSVF